MEGSIKWALAAWIAYMVVALSLAGGLLYVGIHFIAKCW